MNASSCPVSVNALAAFLQQDEVSAIAAHIASKFNRNAAGTAVARMLERNSFSAMACVDDVVALALPLGRQVPGSGVPHGQCICMGTPRGHRHGHRTVAPPAPGRCRVRPGDAGGEQPRHHKDATLMPRRACQPGAWLVALAALAGCAQQDTDTVHVQLRYLAAAGSPPLTDVAVVAGGDRFSWPALPPRQPESITLQLRPGDSREVTLLYRFHGAARSWTSPASGPAPGLVLRLDVSATGDTVPGQSCRPPCSD